MATPQKPSKHTTSRWNFLSQAVNAVESRLDTILADEEDALKRVQPPPPPAVKENATPPRGSHDSPRTSTASTTNDRLQQRLAHAMAKRNNAKLDGTPTTSEPSSMVTTPMMSPPRGSLQQDEGAMKSESGIESVLDASLEPQAAHLSLDKLNGLGTPTLVEPTSIRHSRESHDASHEVPTRASSDETDAAILQVQLEHEDEKSKLQEEIQGYIERIDALSSKLQYLAREAAQSARDGSNVAENGSLEKKLSEKDEKIALLLEEGQKLSVTEMKNLTIIKKLRGHMAVSAKDQDAIRKRAEIAERQVLTLDEKAKKAEQMLKKVEAQTSTLAKTSQDLEAVTRERNALNATLAEVRAQVTRANTRAENAESNATTEKLEAERKRCAELQDDLSSAKIERELAEDKLKRDLRDMQSSLEREKEQSRAMETEMLAEQAMLESKLEAFRVRAEEASSNDQGDSQAKLLRQIETLQSQYAAASQNWQGIEGTLLARITTLEKDRDEVTAREIDVRKKLRDVTLKGKNNERENEEAQLQLAAAMEGQTDTQAELQRLSRRNEQLEEDVNSSQKELEEQKARLERDFSKRMDEEKAKWAASISRVRTESPSHSTRKSSAHDLDRLAGPVERPMSRKSSALEGSQRQYSTSYLRGLPNGSVIETPPIIALPDDDYFADAPVTPGSGNNQASRRGLNDLVSNSTIGAGPSVQLVERMSANVRRLESEKAASKDELARITGQRDESRSEVVRLMREVEQKRKVDERLKLLEDEHKSLNERHQTTLVLLGEKSEQVDELKQDIMDVKQMYRDLADHMK